MLATLLLLLSISGQAILLTEQEAATYEKKVKASLGLDKSINLKEHIDNSIKYLRGLEDTPEKIGQLGDYLHRAAHLAEKNKDYLAAYAIHEESMYWFILNKKSGIKLKSSWDDGIEHVLEHMFMNLFDHAYTLMLSGEVTLAEMFFDKALSFTKNSQITAYIDHLMISPRFSKRYLSLLNYKDIDEMDQLLNRFVGKKINSKAMQEVVFIAKPKVKLSKIKSFEEKVRSQFAIPVNVPLKSFLEIQIKSFKEFSSSEIKAWVLAESYHYLGHIVEKEKDYLQAYKINLESLKWYKKNKGLGCQAQGCWGNGVAHAIEHIFENLYRHAYSLALSGNRVAAEKYFDKALNFIGEADSQSYIIELLERSPLFPEKYISLIRYKESVLWSQLKEMQDSYQVDVYADIESAIDLSSIMNSGHPNSCASSLLKGL